MIVITSHVIVYIELDFDDVVALYQGQFIITPTDTPFTYHFYTFVNVPDSGPNHEGWIGTHLIKIFISDSLSLYHVTTLLYWINYQNTICISTFITSYHYYYCRISFISFCLKLLYITYNFKRGVETPTPKTNQLINQLSGTRNYFSK